MDKYFGKLSEECAKKATSAKKIKMVARKDSENYLQFGFILTEDPDFPRSLCLLCGERLSNQVMMPSKLKRHLEGKHESIAHKEKFFFAFESTERKAIDFIKNLITVSYKAFEASYAVVKNIAKTKFSFAMLAKFGFTIGKSLVLPCWQEIVKIIINKSVVKKVKRVALEDNSISRRINDMSDDILSELKDSLMKSEVFPPQLDESTDIQGKAQLPANIRYMLKTIV